MREDNGQPTAGRGRGADRALPEPAAGQPALPGAAVITSPTRAIRRRAKLPSLSPEAAAYAADAYAPAGGST